MFCKLHFGLSCILKKFCNLYRSRVSACHGNFRNTIFSQQPARDRVSALIDTTSSISRSTCESIFLLCLDILNVLIYHWEFIIINHAIEDLNNKIWYWKAPSFWKIIGKSSSWKKRDIFYALSLKEFSFSNGQFTYISYPWFQEIT